MLASITDPESELFATATRREQVEALDSVAMLELHEWLNHMRFRLFGGLRPWDQQDAVHETFIRTLEFAHKMRNPGALYRCSPEIFQALMQPFLSMNPAPQ